MEKVKDNNDISNTISNMSIKINWGAELHNRCTFKTLGDMVLEVLESHQIVSVAKIYHISKIMACIMGDGKDSKDGSGKKDLKRKDLKYIIELLRNSTFLTNWDKSVAIIKIKEGCSWDKDGVGKESMGDIDW